MSRTAILTADLGYGDAGKGSIVDYLVRQTAKPIIVRYNGGPQAAHNVVTADGRHHTFSQFGSGSFVSGVRTHLSRSMLINPLACFKEAAHLRSVGVHDIWLRTTFDEEATVVTPFHMAMNQLRETARGEGRHGSCGQGVGETRALQKARPMLTIRMQDLSRGDQLRWKLRLIQEEFRTQAVSLRKEVPPSQTILQALDLLHDRFVVEELVRAYGQFLELARVTDVEHLARLAGVHESLIFEGAQGVLLDEKYGFHPHTTWSDITFRHALDVLENIGYDGNIVRLGLLRGYAVRHGVGPFVTEDIALGQDLPDEHNVTNRWQGDFRVGYPDLVITRYAIDVLGGVDELAVTMLDRMSQHSKWRIATGYQLAATANESDCFELDPKGVARRIKFQTAKDLVRQEGITKALFTSKSVYTELATPSGPGRIESDGDVRTYLDLLSSQLGIPITITSFGPTASDKRRLV